MKIHLRVKRETCGHIIGTMVITEGELEKNKSGLEPLGPWRHWRQF